MTSNGYRIDLSGKRALVTGGSRGIGAAVVDQFSKAGADVAIGFATRSNDAERVAAGARSHDVMAVAIAADISTREGAEHLVREATEQLGGLDFFVGNAGIWPPDDVAMSDMTDEQWERTIRQNLDSIFFTTRAAIRVIGTGGSIVLISSTAGQRGEAFHSDYAASKGAVISMTKSLAVELGPSNIRVNCVAPGWVDTEMVKDAIAAEGRERIVGEIPLRRIAAPDDIAGPVLFLCSSLSQHVTGEILNVNGGSVLSG